MSALADLQAGYWQLRAEDAETGMRRLATANAYERWFNQACADGEPPDQLRRYIADEVERFFARTIQGPDGHVYWDGKAAMPFRRNDGTDRKATWWWWDRVHGPAGRGRLDPTCGERHRINPEHLVFIPWSEVGGRDHFSDARILGSLQVVAMRLGHSPTTTEYTAVRAHPVVRIIAARFGGWRRALAAAGLPPPPVSPHSVVAVAKWTLDDCLDALRAGAAEFGGPPSTIWWDHQHRKPSRKAIIARFGSWSEALRKAGVT